MTALLEARGLGKSFGPVQVLHGVDLRLEAGEVHAVIGENGAGKSTLMRLLSGHLRPDGGEIRLDGRPVHFAGPVAAESAGIVLVHQEILLADSLTVAQNIFLGRELRRGPFVDDRRMRAVAAERLAELDCPVDPEARVRGLSIAERQLVQIARALLVPHRVVIFDEPTAVLTPVEVQALFAIIRRLKAQGVAILYISHRLAEVEALADHVTVLRDGRLVGTYPAGLSQGEMARLMVGRELASLYPDKPAMPAPERVLEVEQARVPGFVEEASFALHKGEILGFAGLTGAGRTELFEGLMGLRPATAARASLGGRPLRLGHTRAAIDAGIGYLTEDRKGKGLLLKQRLAPNLTLIALDRFRRGPFIDGAAEAAALERATKTFDIRVRDPGALAGQLSGGNQQKLMLAKTMLAGPEVVVIDEPTRGIDIGTKSQIYAFIAELARAGKACVVISSEMAELIGLCHRILVMRAGRIVGELTGAEMTEQNIVVHATGVSERELERLEGAA